MKEALLQLFWVVWLMGSKLPPVIIFKLKNIPRGTFPDGIFVRANEMIWWVENVWSKRTNDDSLLNPRSLLVLDSFRGHLVEAKI